MSYLVCLWRVEDGARRGVKEIFVLKRTDLPRSSGEGAVKSSQMKFN